MQNRISDIVNRLDNRNQEPTLIGQILDELLAKFEQRFPNVRITVVETAATTV